LRKGLTFIICLSMLCPPLFAQRRRGGETSPVTPRVTESPVKLSKEEALILVRILTDRVLSYNNSTLKIETLIEIADSVWDHDEFQARQLFFKSRDLLNALEVQSISAQVVAGPSSEQQQVTRLRRRLVSEVAGKDRQLALQLGTEYGMQVPQYSDQRQYRRGFRQNGSDLSRVSQLAERAVQGDQRNGGTRRVVRELRELHRQDPASANRLFMQTMDQLSNSPNPVDAEDLLRLGSFAFGRNRGREQVNEEVGRFFMQKATSLLSAKAVNPDELRENAEAAQRLLSRARRHYPEYAPQLELTTNSYRAEIQSRSVSRRNQRNSEKVSPVKSPQETYGASVEEIARLTGAAERDSRLVEIFRRAFDKGDVEGSGYIAQYISDAVMRYELAKLVQFIEAQRSIEKGDIHQAEQATDKLCPDVTCTLLLLSLASHYSRKNEVMANLSLSRLMSETSKLDPKTQILLLLSIAELSGRHDPRGSERAFHQAIDLINKEDSADEPEKIYRPVKQIQSGENIYSFPLRVRSVNFGRLNQVARRLLRTSPQSTVSNIISIKNEKHSESAVLSAVDGLFEMIEVREDQRNNSRRNFREGGRRASRLPAPTQ
jgi:hypothetical protein